MPRWEYNWVYTKAQLELMAHDVSYTAYKAREKEKPKMGEYHKPDKEKMHETYLKWKLRKAQGKFNLKKFLGNGQKKQDNGQGNTQQDPQK